MNYYGESGSNDRSSSAGGSSSRKGKKSGSDKPKQPQRGLGVAQLEKIRLHSQMGLLPQEDIRIQTAYSSSSSFSYTSPSTASFNTLQGHHSHMMGTGELERTNYVYGESQFASSNPGWDASYAQPAGISRHFFSPELVEDSLRKKIRKDQHDSGSQNSDSNGSQELDLELRLSL
ncbi:putative SPEAR family protein [Helianthus annuus]|nr:putative SPEAR family protein [Helianthus annuus]KAJ0885720.1 putative SPEAR family protein [Helianthus annuus]